MARPQARPTEAHKANPIGTKLVAPEVPVTTLPLLLSPSVTAIAPRSLKTLSSAECATSTTFGEVDACASRSKTAVTHVIKAKSKKRFSRNKCVLRVVITSWPLLSLDAVAGTE